jgi:divalent metal cation (Fe/Co/Zn/Cd) transporter
MADGDIVRASAAASCGDIVTSGTAASCVEAGCGSDVAALKPAPKLALTPARAALIRRAFRLEWMTVAWMVVEGGVAISAGVAACSLTLMAFGLDSVIELASAGVLIWRLTVELRQGQGFSERVERTASRIGGVLLFTLAAYIVVGAAWSLWTRQGEVFSLPGLIIALLAMPIMTLLARRKIAIATQLGSRAMRADAAESITCGWLSLVVVVGLLADLALGAWWVDAVTSLAIVGFVVKEARAAWNGEDCCGNV